MTTHTSHQMQLTSMFQYSPWNEQEVNQKFRQQTKADIINLLQKNHSLTDREMADILGYPDPNKVRPRRNELLKEGIVEEHEKRICNVGKKLSIAWRLSKEKLHAFMRS